LETPVNLAGLEYIKYDSSDLEKLSNQLQQWFKQVKSERYQSDDYLLGHLLKVEKMALVLNNFNTEGDTSTEYEILVQKIGIGETDKDLFAMPYHDSVSVDVPDDYFNLTAIDSNKNPLDVKKIIFSSRLKRFCIVIKNITFEEKKIFL
jgi:hypothetical protein